MRFEVLFLFLGQEEGKVIVASGTTMSSPMEAQIIDGICPGAEKEKVEGFISKILAVEEQLEAKKSASEAANLAMTRYKCESCGNKDQSLFSGGCFVLVVERLDA